MIDEHDTRKARIEIEMIRDAEEREFIKMKQERNDALDKAILYKSALYMHVEFPSHGEALEKAAQFKLQRDKLRAAMELFCQRRERGEIQSSTTYRQFKELLELTK